MSKEELLKYLIAEIDLIMHDKDYRFENQDGTWYSRESCRDLTNEEVFEELKSELMQLNSQVEQISDLEAKLAEKDKLIEFYINSGKEQCDEINKINHRSIIKADEIEQLKQQLAEKDKEIESLKTDWNKHCDYLGECIVKYDDEDVNDIYSEILSKVNEIRKYDYKYNKDKISFAVEQLEKVKEKMRQNITITAPANELKKLRDYLIGVDDYIDNQIKAIKGEK